MQIEQGTEVELQVEKYIALLKSVSHRACVQGSYHRICGLGLPSSVSFARHMLNLSRTLTRERDQLPDKAPATQNPMISHFSVSDLAAAYLLQRYRRQPHI